jgi:hypothetical protein
VQRGRDSVSIPNAVGVVAFAVRLDRKRRRHAGEGRRHSNPTRIARLGNKKTLRMKPRKRAEYFVFVDIDLARNFRRVGDLTSVGGDFVNRELDLRVNFVAHADNYSAAAAAAESKQVLRRLSEYASEQLLAAARRRTKPALVIVDQRVEGRRDLFPCSTVRGDAAADRV